MIFREFIETVTAAELDYIARLDYGQDFDTHRKALNVVIADGGVVDTALQGVWFSLEVIELCRNSLQPGHGREFALCAAITLKTGSVGDEAERLVDYHMDEIQSLPDGLREMLEKMLGESINGCEQNGGDVRV